MKKNGRLIRFKNYILTQRTLEVFVFLLFFTTLCFLYARLLIKEEMFIGLLSSFVTISGFYIVSKQNSNLEKYKFIKNEEIKIFNIISDTYQPVAMINTYNEILKELSGNSRSIEIIHKVAKQEVVHKLSSIQVKVRVFFKLKRGDQLHHLIGSYTRLLIQYLDTSFEERNSIYSFDSSGQVTDIRGTDNTNNIYLRCTDEYENIISEINNLINKI